MSLGFIILAIVSCGTPPRQYLVKSFTVSELTAMAEVARIRNGEFTQGDQKCAAVAAHYYPSAGGAAHD